MIVRPETEKLIEELTREIDMDLFCAQAKDERGGAYEEFTAKKYRYVARQKIKRLDWLLIDFDNVTTSIGASGEGNNEN